MKLSQLLHDKDYRIAHDPEITNITSDSREVKEGSLFFCIQGAKVDARTFINDSFAKGAAAVIHEGELLEPPQGPAIQVKDVRRALSFAAAAFHGEPSKALRNIAITGTSGKTSVAWILSHALHALGCRTFLGGTLGYTLLRDHTEPAQGIKELANTSIEPIAVHRFLADALSSGAQASVFEATSQGIVQSRMRDVAWDGAIFTNLTRDHLDLHGSMEQYEAAKRELFTSDLVNSRKPNKFAIFNFDDDAGCRIAHELKTHHPEIRVLSFSTKPGSKIDFHISDLRADARSLAFCLAGKGQEIHLSSSFIGTHNACNISCAAIALLASGYEAATITKVINNVLPVPGRLEPAHAHGHTIFIDYAHKPDALEKVLRFLRPLCEGRLISVFGCGGDRDKGKRPIMGKVAQELSDICVITSDNPRNEDPRIIIDDILAGIEDRASSRVIVEGDRRAAIGKAIEIAHPNDVILIAGKGHEPYQEIHGIKYPFHDGSVARELASPAMPVILSEKTFLAKH